MRIAEARGLWEPETTYLNTASYGLPPRPAWEALQGALADWRAGRTSWEHWGEYAEAARAAFASMCSVPVEWVAIGANASTMVGLVAAALPDGARVVSAEGEFTSALWPFLAQGRGIEVETVPVARLAEALDARTDAVAFSAVQSADGELADLAGISAAAAHHGALTVVDATQACGWLPLDAARFDVVVCAAYKWLLSPRGSSFMTVRPGARRAPDAARRRLVRGRRPVQLLLRHAPAAGGGCAPLRRQPGLVLLGGDGAGGPAVGGDRRRADLRS